MRKFLERLKEKWNDYLERLARSNSEQYGNRRLDCCGMNDDRRTRPQKGRS